MSVEEKGIEGTEPVREDAHRSPSGSFRIEVGKTYVTRDGRFRATVTRCLGENLGYRGEWVGDGPRDSWEPEYEWFSSNGRTDLGCEMDRDLVEEATAAELARPADASEAVPPSPSYLELVEAAFRAGYGAGHDSGMNEASDDPMRHNDSPHVDAAWVEFKASKVKG